MTYFELLSTEKDYVGKLTDDERRIYMANQKQLAAIDTWNDYAVRQFVDVSRLLNEVHRLHGRYNEITDYLFDKPNMTDEQQKYYDSVNEINEELFTVSLAVGAFSAVFNLSCMDECDALYVYLAKVKMTRFDWLCDNFDVPVLIETLVSHEVY
jgi:hypothetical protein